MAKNWKQSKPTEGERAKAASDEKKTIARNKRARHDLEIEDTLEAGIALAGTEVKALRMGRANIVDGWARLPPKWLAVLISTPTRHFQR